MLEKVAKWAAVLESLCVRDMFDMAMSMGAYREFRLDALACYSPSRSAFALSYRRNLMVG